MLSISDIIMLADKFKVIDKIKNIYHKLSDDERLKRKKEEPERVKKDDTDNTTQDNTPKIVIDEDIPYKDLDKRLEIYDLITSEGNIVPCTEYGNLDSPLKMIVVDDLETINNYYINLLKQYSNKYNVDIFSKYHILLFTGEKCGYRAYKYIKNNKIRLALLDITLNQSIKYQDDNTIYYMTIDGPDIASLISKEQPKVRYMFNTGHRISDDNVILHKYLNKIKAIANRYLLQYNKLFINKDSSTIIDSIHDYLADDEYIRALSN
jgi:hypothetical protein